MLKFFNAQTRMKYTFFCNDRLRLKEGRNCLKSPYLDCFNLVSHHVLHFFCHLFDHGKPVHLFDFSFALVSL